MGYSKKDIPVYSTCTVYLRDFSAFISEPAPDPLLKESHVSLGLLPILLNAHYLFLFIGP